MPYFFETKYEYKSDKYQIQMTDAVNKFPFLAGKEVSGEILASNVDNKVSLIRESFRCQIMQDFASTTSVGALTDPNPLEKGGLPPCQLLVALYRYKGHKKEKSGISSTVERPIAESEIVKGPIYCNYFQDIVGRLWKEEEIRIALEATTFHPELTKSPDFLKEAYVSFSEERYADTQTSCRKILETLRLLQDWKTIDNSEKVVEGFSAILRPVHSFASRGAHSATIKQEEAEFILKTVAAMLFYVNSILKGGRFELKKELDSTTIRTELTPSIPSQN